MTITSHSSLTTHPPAKLNLFLELISKRADGFHEIDTVMIPIDWCDKLSLSLSDGNAIELTVQMPEKSRAAAAQPADAELERVREENHQNPTSAAEDIPCDHRNLVYRALAQFKDRFEISSGFHCHLTKSIPAGAGLGGASSDAASALRLAAKLHKIAPTRPEMREIAASLGSDIPFFLGCPGKQTQDETRTTNAYRAARGTGRGEVIERVECPAIIDFVVIFPGIGLSTPAVYSASSVPSKRQESRPILQALRSGERDQIARLLVNRLQAPAKKLASGVLVALESLQHAGLLGSQMTGSGSACFGIAENQEQARSCAESLREQLGPRFIIQAARSTEVPRMMY